MTHPGTYWRTLRHLTVRQVVYQVWNRLRGRPRLRQAATPHTGNVPGLQFPITFTFLNQSVTFTERIDWNYATNGKLWTYNLNYFTSDGRGTTPIREGGTGAVPHPGEVMLALIHDFIRQTAKLIDGLEPYPTSLRVLNWQAFLLHEGIQDHVIEQHLFAQTALLRSRLEYHLGGNHLLENACALTIMAVHFRHRAWFEKGTKLLREQLTDQILNDGGHYERSPVYHQILTDRLLDLYAVLQDSDWAGNAELLSYIRGKTVAMLDWLVSVTFRDGSVPMVNDAAEGVGPTTAELVAKARLLGFNPTRIPLCDSGYRMLTTSRLEVFIDIGPVGPNHQPGHAHADTFSFILHLDGQPVIVDPGTSTYQIGARRSWERSTAAHNTVTVAGADSSEVWSGFRVGRRAQVRVQIDTPQCVEATHDGYVYLGEQHTRRWTIVDETTFSINDTFVDTNVDKKYYLHFYPGIYLGIEQNRIELTGGVLTFSTGGLLNPDPSTYEQACGFNRTRPASQVTFDLSTTVTTLFTAHP